LWIENDKAIESTAYPSIEMKMIETQLLYGRT